MKRITINTLVDIGCMITFIPSLVTRLVLHLLLHGKFFLHIGRNLKGGAGEPDNLLKRDWLTNPF